MSLKLYVAGHQYQMKQWKFPTGEVGIRLANGEDGCKDSLYNVQGNECSIRLNWEGNDDLLALGQVVDALRKARASKISLDIPYFPYSRQDRRCHVGEGHALKVLANYINSLNFDTVYTADAHSDVLDTLVDRLSNENIHSCSFNLPHHEFIVAPDAGASKKLVDHRWVKEYKSSKLLVGEKMRDGEGKIVQLYINGARDVAGKSVCVMDDLCDKGTTFLKVAEVIKQFQPKELNLYITHGFFTGGFHDLMKEYTNIYTHNLKNTDVGEYASRVHVI